MKYEKEIHKLFEEIGVADIMVLSTAFHDKVTSRLVSIIVHEGMFYFMTDKTFRKYEQIKGNPKVALCVKHISIEGICKEIGTLGENQELCEIYKQYYPKDYKRYSAVKNERLFRIEPAYIQLWTYEGEQAYISYFDVKNQLYRKVLYTGEAENSREALTRKLLSMGGQKVLMPETVSEDIYNFGHLYNYRVLVPVGGTSRYFLKHEEEVRVLWGFVLDEAGIWEMHSWLIDQSHQVIIDNQAYEKYFGFIK